MRIDYRSCSLSYTTDELKQARERDWESGLIVEFPIVILFVEIKALTHTHKPTDRQKNYLPFDRPYPFILENLLMEIMKKKQA